VCQQNTDEHDEYQLLIAMGRRYAAERAVAQADDAVSTAQTLSLAAAAARLKLDVHFIIEPGHDTVVGYIATKKEALPHAPLLLVQVYVERACRRIGFATSALRVLLSDVSAVAIPTDNQIMCRILRKLGFTDGRDLFVDDAIYTEPDETDDASQYHTFPYIFYRGGSQHSQNHM
jgi:hypothetical protein